MFHVGQKVVCIKRDAWTCDNDPSDPPPCKMPEYGEVCTVVGVHSTPWGSEYLELQEYPHEVLRVRFHVSRFRPVVERKTDISIFTAMLNPKKESVDA